MLKRLLSLVMAVSIVLSFVPSTVFATEGENTTVLPTTQTEAAAPEGGSATATPEGGSASKEGASASAAATAEDGWSWSLDGTVLTISGKGPMDDNPKITPPWGTGITKVIIEPGITAIGAYAFYNCTALAEVSISSTVTTIGAYAFMNCIKLTSFEVPVTVLNIEQGAFSGCRNLQSMTLPFAGESRNPSSSRYALFGYIFGTTQFTNSTTQAYTAPNVLGAIVTYYLPSSLTSVTITGQSVGKEAFKGCTALTTVTLKEGVTTIGEDAFASCTSLSAVVLPESLKTIGDRAFKSCSKLRDFEIPNGIVDIGEYAFTGTAPLYTTDGDGKYFGNSENPYLILADTVNTTLKSFTFKPETKFILDSAFYGCSSLTSIVIPDQIVRIGAQAFYNCKGLTSITLPENLTHIGEKAFYNCTKLTTIQIPRNVVSIGASAFYGCSALTRAETTDLGAWCAINFANGTANPTNKSKKLYVNGQLLTNLVVPSNATRIGSYAFYSLTGITSVTIGQGVESIGSHAFDGCTGLKSVQIGNGLKLIDQYAFQGCSALTQIVLPNTLESIGMAAFKKCAALTEIVIPDSVKNIDSDILAQCAGLTSITIPFVGANLEPESYPKYTLGYLFGTVSYTGGSAARQTYAYSGSKSSATYYIPTVLTSVTVTGGNIPRGAFQNCKKLKEINIPAAVTEIGDEAFYYCTGLTSFTVPSGVTSLGTGVFRGCTGLKEITISSTLDSLGEEAFYGCTGLTELAFPKGVATIGDSAFRGCTSLKEVTVGSRLQDVGAYAFYGCTALNRVVLPESVTSIGTYAFYNCKTLTDFRFPESLEFLNSYAFSGCSSLNMPVNLKNLTGLGGNAFQNCVALPEVTIPGTVQIIGKYAFAGCTALKKVTIGDGVLTIDDYAFQNCAALESIAFPNSVKTIGESVMSGCEALLAVTIPFVGQSRKTAEDANQYPFGYLFGTTAYNGSYACEQTYKTSASATTSTAYHLPGKLKSVTVTGGEILDGAFQSCLRLQEIQLPAGIKKLGARAFSDCNNLQEIEIPESVTHIGSSAFDHCISLKEIHIPYGVIEVGSAAFKECTSLKEIVIPDSVLRIGSGVFGCCINLESITVPFIGSNRIVSDGNFQFPLGYFFLDAICLDHGYPNTTQTYYVAGTATKETRKSYIPYSLMKVTVTGGELFYGAFQNCTYIKTIVLGENVKNIGTSGVFTGTNNLEQFIVDENNPNYCSVNRILYNKDKTKIIWTPGKHAYHLQLVYTYINGETALETEIVKLQAGQEYNVTVPMVPGYSTRIETVTGTMPAEDVTVTVVYYENDRLLAGQCTDTLSWTLYTDGALVLRGTGEIPDYPDGAPWAAYAENIKMVYLDSRITRVGDSAFAGCSNLTFVDWGHSVKTIGASAFADCTALTSIRLPDSLQTLGEGAFRGCTGLKSAVISDSVTTISGSAFRGCSELVQVTIGGAVTEIGDNAFADCGKLTQVYFRGKPVILGSNALGPKNDKFVYYYSTVEGWDEVITDSLWNGYLAVPYNAIAKENFNGTNVYIIKVVDKYNTPLQNATVYWNGAEQPDPANSDGMVYYTRPTEAVRLEIRCDDHITFLDESFWASQTQIIDVIELSDKPSTVQGLRMDRQSIATSVAVLNCGESKTVQIAVRGYSKYTIVKYELYQGERLISTVATDQGTCTFAVNTASFEEGQTVLVRMHTADGNMVATALNIDVIKLLPFDKKQFVEEMTSMDMQLGMGELGKVDLELPIKFHGLEEIHVYTEGRSIFIAIGLNLKDVFDRKIDKKKIAAMLDDAWKEIGEGGASSGIEAKIGGYVELEYIGPGDFHIKSSYVRMGVELKLESGLSASFFGLVGVYYKVYITAEGGIGLKIIGFDSEEGLKIDEAEIYYGGSLGLEGGAFILCGVGRAGVYSEVRYGATLLVYPQFDVKEVFITGEIGIRWSLLWGLAEDSYIIGSGDIYRWPEKTKLRRMLYSMQRDPNSYTLNDRGYLENRSPWLTEGEYLQKHIYDNVAPQIVTCGDTMMMLWLDDNSQRSSMNFQTLYYSLYENGKWSAPVAVDDNGTFDCEFDVCVADGKIYVIYTEMGNQQSDVATLDITDANALESFVNGVEVNVIVYEKGAFGKPVQLTDNEICEQLPQIDNADGVLTATWLESNETGLLEEATDNAIRSATLGENGWSEKVDVATGQNIVSDLVAVSLGGKTYTAYIVDADGSQETNEDQTLILRTQEGEAIHLDSGLIMEVSSAYIKDTPVLLWNNNGKPYMVAAADQTPVCLMPENAKYGMDFQIVSLPKEQNLMFFVASNYDAEGNAVDGTDVYCAYVDLNGCLTASVRMTETEGNISKYAVSYRDEKILAVYTETIANMENGEVQTVSHLRNAALEFYTDLIVDGVDFSTILVQPGTQLEVELTLRNGGTNAIDGIRVNLLDNGGKLLYTAEQAVTLPSGASQTSKVTLVLPQTIAKEAYSLEVLPQYGMAEAVDARPEDNKKDLALAYADLQIEAEQKIIGEKNYISIAVANGGNVSAGALLQVYAGERLLSELQTGEIAPGQVQQYMVDINAMTTGEDKLVTCTLTADFYDYCTFNDSDAVALLHIEDSYFATDPEQVIHNPELLSNTGRYDKYAPQAVVIEITEEGKYFTGIEGLTEGTHYVVEKNKITLQNSYLSTLEPKTHSFRLVFDFGYEQPASREFALTVEDTTPVALSGSVSIRGDVAVDRTVSADLSGLETGVGNVLYSWSIDGTVVSTEASYTVKMADYGKELTLTVTGKNGYTGSLTASATVGLYQPAAPVKPVLSKVESDRITVVKVAGLEYSLDGATWQEESTFAGLQPNKQYTIYARVKATSTSLSSAVSDGVTATTRKLTVQAPAAPQVASKTQTQIVLVGDSAMEYRMEGGSWTTDPVFSGLKDNTTYVFYQRYKETDTQYASPESAPTAVTTPEIVVLRSIAVTTLPTKLSYLEATEVLDVSGGKLTLSYSDGTTEVVELTKQMVSGFDNTVFGKQTLSVTYEGKTTTFTVEILPLDHTVVFKNWDGTVLSTKIYHKGDIVTAPSAPTKASDKTYSYIFDGWDKDVVVCRGDAEYTATFKAVYIDYTVIFRDEDGTELSKKTYHYGEAVTAPAAPSKAADKVYTYTFDGWDQEVVACEGNVTYTATYKAAYIDYTVIFRDEDGTELSRKTYHYGEAVTAPAEPVKAADNTYTYNFAGWGSAVVPCQGNAEYKAVFVPVYIDYTVIFQLEDGTVLSTKTYHYGDAVEIPEDPAAPENHAFLGWDAEVTACQGDATYTAVFKKLYTPGDLDGVEGVTDADAVYLLYHTFVPDLYPVDQDCDFNGDGEVNDGDAVHLLYYTFLPDLYPLH